jgi:hypothetical protein
MLDLEMSAVAWMMQSFPEVKEIDDMRKTIGRYGLSGKQQASQILRVYCWYAHYYCIPVFLNSKTEFRIIDY